jgi:tRNA (guanine37-N1)-methyltransferase
LCQTTAQRLAKEPALMLICGRYEGFDERVREFVDEEVSLGDFVMTGGEVAAMAVMEACVRLLPGVLGNEASTHEESHSPESFGLLEYPQFTRPVEFRGQRVPDVLSGGNHAAIAAWRSQEALERTRRRRPDLVAAYEQRLMAAALEGTRERDSEVSLAGALGASLDASLDRSSEGSKSPSEGGARKGDSR